MLFSKPAGHKFIARADQESFDFTLTDFNRDDAWHDLDLSAIIPIGTKAVFLSGLIRGTANNVVLKYAKAGYSGNYIYSIVSIAVPNIDTGLNVLVPVSDALKIQYKIPTSVSYTNNIVVVGWIKR